MGRLRLSLLATVSAVAFATQASAADQAMPVKAVKRASPVVTWTGLYAGVSLGAAINRSRFTDVDNFLVLLPGGLNNEFWNNSHASFTAGGLLGFNWQVGQMVVGIEGDWNWVSSKAEAVILQTGPGPIVASSELKRMNTLRGRLGYAVTPTTLVYGTGGAAWARFSDFWGRPASGVLATVSDSYKRSGWVAGGGVEHMFAPNWTVRIEALHADFGTREVAVLSGPTYRTQFEHAVTQVRGALIAKW